MLLIIDLCKLYFISAVVYLKYCRIQCAWNDPPVHPFDGDLQQITSIPNIIKNPFSQN